jgi:DNA-binding response OmpR family regulator
MTKIKLLIIEDDSSLVDILKKAIDVKKYDMAIATEADEGVDYAMKLQPDIIILDILLPGKNAKTRNVPVIILSNIGQEEEVKKGMSLGAKDYLIKADFTIDQVLKKIDKYIKKK